MTGHEAAWQDYKQELAKRDAGDEVVRLRAENEQLRRQIEGHCERISAQSALLSRAADRRVVSDPSELERVRARSKVERPLDPRDMAWLLAEIDRLTAPPPRPSSSAGTTTPEGESLQP